MLKKSKRYLNQKDQRLIGVWYEAIRRGESKAWVANYIRWSTSAVAYRVTKLRAKGYNLPRLKNSKPERKDNDAEI